MNEICLQRYAANGKWAKSVCSISLQTENEQNLFAACRCKQKMNEICLQHIAANRK
jgi:hypothetical protein